MRSLIMPDLFVVTLFFYLAVPAQAEPPELLWPELAPGEMDKLTGTAQPPRSNEMPPVTRVINITAPSFTVHVPPNPNGSAMVILPGGGFAKVVSDKEGSEAADWLNRLGVTAFVLSYRTSQRGQELPGWVEPLQDAQRMLKFVRFNSERWNLDSQRIGLLGFSAGGQVAARLLCDEGRLAYESIDQLDAVSHRPDFAILVYPWNIYDAQTDALVEGVAIPENCPPTFLVHTGDDRSSSLGAVLFYAALKRNSIPAELHVFGNGGHGYGLRPVEGSLISSWPRLAGHWLKTQAVLE